MEKLNCPSPISVSKFWEQTNIRSKVINLKLSSFFVWMTGNNKRVRYILPRFDVDANNELVINNCENRQMFVLCEDLY